MYMLLSIELENLTPGAKVKVELYAGNNLIITKEKSSLGTGTTCTFYTNSTSSWTETSTGLWAYDYFVPTHAVLYINGVEIDADEVDADLAEQWVAFPGTAEPPSGTENQPSNDDQEDTKIEEPSDIEADDEAKAADKAVDTGDDMNMVIPFVIGGIALVAMAVVVFARRRFN